MLKRPMSTRSAFQFSPIESTPPTSGLNSPRAQSPTSQPRELAPKRFARCASFSRATTLLSITPPIMHRSATWRHQPTVRGQACKLKFWKLRTSSRYARRLNPLLRPLAPVQDPSYQVKMDDEPCHLPCGH